MLLLLSMFACGDKSSDTSATDVTSDTSTENTEGTDTESSDTDETQEDSANAESLQVGDVVITEIMKNPCGVTGSETAVNGQGEEYLSISCTEPQIADEQGEWFEVYNASAGEINLNGLMVHELDDGNGDTEEETFLITEDVVVAAGEYVVFGVSADTSLNGGVDVDVVYAHGSFSLKNGDDSIVLSNSVELLDVVSFNDAEFPDYKGHSMSLHGDLLTSSDNDSGANWYSCPDSTQAVLPSGDFGTPGTANDCP